MNPIDVIGWTLLHFVWQGALIGVITAIVLAMMTRASSQARYVTACVAMITMLATPVVTAYRLSTGVAATQTSALPRAADVRAAAAAPPTSVSRSMVAPVSRTSGSQPRRALLPVVVVWMSGVCVMLLRLATDWWRLRRLHRSALHAAASPLQRIADSLALRTGCSFAVHVVDTVLVDTPSVVGWLRPVILLPVAALSSLTPAQVEAILLHELGHICRHDYLINVLQTATEAVLFFHPAVWWVSKRIRIEREHCCDDIAVAVSDDPIGYAKALAHLATWQSAQPTRLVTAASGGSLFDRIKRLVDRRPAASGSRANALTLMLVAVLLFAVVEYSPSAMSLHAPVAGRASASRTRQAVPRPAFTPAPAPLPSRVLELSATRSAQHRDLQMTSTEHFDVYYPEALRDRVERIGGVAETAYAEVASDFKHELAFRPALVVVATSRELNPTSVFATPRVPLAGERILLSADLRASRLPGQLRHEITHVFAFDILPSTMPVPRWIREGLSEHERHEVDGVALQSLRTMAINGGLPAISRIDSVAFPTNPRLDDALGQQAFEMIAQRWGWDGIRQFLFAARAEKGRLTDVYMRALGVTADEFDRALTTYLRRPPPPPPPPPPPSPPPTARPPVAQQHAGSPADMAAFDVVSIKPSAANNDFSRLIAAPGGRVTGSNVTLKSLVRQAYGVGELEIDGSPAWFESARFDIEAKAADNPSMSQLQTMLRTMLEERFGLVIHREPRERQVYVLVKVRPNDALGEHLRMATFDCDAFIAKTNGRLAPPPAGAGPSDHPACGLRVRPGEVVGTATPIARLAMNLSVWTGRLVVDRTGLTGNYDFDLKWTPNPSSPSAGAPEAADAHADGASIFTAVQEQLGLKLQAQRLPVEVLVIDRASRPAEN